MRPGQDRSTSIRAALGSTLPESSRSGAAGRGAMSQHGQRGERLMVEQSWQVITEQRLGLARLLEGLSDPRWEQPSLWRGWRVRDVAAHVAMAPQVPGLGSMLADGIRARGAFTGSTTMLPCATPPPHARHRCRAAHVRGFSPVAGGDELPQHPLRCARPHAGHRDPAGLGLSDAIRGCPGRCQPSVDRGMAVLGPPPATRYASARHRH